MRRSTFVAYSVAAVLAAFGVNGTLLAADGDKDAISPVDSIVEPSAIDGDMPTVNSRAVRELMRKRPNEDLIICLAGCDPNKDKIVYAQPAEPRPASVAKKPGAAPVANAGAPAAAGEPAKLEPAAAPAMTSAPSVSGADKAPAKAQPSDRANADVKMDAKPKAEAKDAAEKQMPADAKAEQPKMAAPETSKSPSKPAIINGDAAKSADKKDAAEAASDKDEADTASEAADSKETAEGNGAEDEAAGDNAKARADDASEGQSKSRMTPTMDEPKGEREQQGHKPRSE